MTPGWITTMTSSQIPQLPSRPRPDFILYPAEPATPATQDHGSSSLPARFHTQLGSGPGQCPGTSSQREALVPVLDPLVFVVPVSRRHRIQPA